MAINDNLQQAIHNYCACNYVNKRSDYCDWTVTIAFYSAIHYLRHLILLKENSNKEKLTYEDLFSCMRRMGEGRHGFQLRYVMNNFSDISFEYSALHDMSNHARYHFYNYGRPEAKLAKEYLDTIRTFVENISEKFHSSSSLQ